MQRTAELVQQSSWMSQTCQNMWTQNLRLLPASIIQELTWFYPSESTTPPGELATSSDLEGTTQSRIAGGQIVPPNPQQNWWPNKWREHFTSACWEWVRMLSWPSQCGGRVTQLQSGKNNITFDYLGETGSELKNNQPKSSITAPRLVLLAEGMGQGSHTSSLWDHLREPNCTRWPIPIRKAWAQIP
jgi:hypothetical protein